MSSPHVFAFSFTMQIYCKKDSASNVKNQRRSYGRKKVEMGLETLVDSVYMNLRIKT